MTERLDDILFLSATDQRRMLIEKRFTATNLTRAYLARIERVNEELNAYVEIDAEGALAQAEDADRRRFLGEDTPVLGLTFGVKDLIDVAGLHTTYGSKAFADNIATKDAPAIARIRQAGGVILGKVNTTEFALFTPNTIKGPSRNPWDLGRTAGGSSNGSATAESGGLCSIAIGTDTAGSIRTPSSFCGVFGVKPTHGRVPAAGIGELSKHMDTVGAMGRCAEDIALTLQVMSGYDADDITSADVPVPDFCNAVQQDAVGLKVSAPDVWVTDVISGEIKAIWVKALELLAGAGAKVNSATLPDVSDIMSVWRGLGAGDIWQCIADLWRKKAIYTLTKVDLFYKAPSPVRLQKSRKRSSIVSLSANRCWTV
jgi:aspartyl-tRNA(Asn)/glutamyl-tRNA(Gln) amidotransferase subunit A